MGLRSLSPGSRRGLKWVTAVLVLAVLAVAATAVLGDPRADSDLSLSQWTRVRDRLLRQAQALTSDSPAPPAAPIPPQEPTPTPRIQEPTRISWPLPDTATVRRQAEEYASRRAKTIVELQPFRRVVSGRVTNGAGEEGTATLVNLNPTINAWYLLTLSWPRGSGATTYHLANSDPYRSDLVLDSLFPAGLVIRSSAGDERCDLWSGTGAESIGQAATADEPYVPLCGDRISLRLRTAGHKTSIEKVTDFLRNHVWGGEAITVFVRETFFVDAFLDTARALTDTAAAPTLPQAPEPAPLDPSVEGSFLAPTELGISVEGAVDGKLAAGTWYPAQGLPGVYLSILRPDLISREVLDSHRDIVAPLDEVERQALSYLVAFDLADFDVAFALGTDHPRVAWSERVPATARDPALPGPDGIDAIRPLVSTGIIGPGVVDRVAATFTGGFKRTHGGFKNGPLSLANHGSHYGFVENGVIFSKLQPGLATLYVLDDGTVDMATWSEAADSVLDRIRFARQNGVPLVAPDTATGVGPPGRLVSNWAQGNWSGSQEGRVRTLRAGACIQERGDTRFLIYAYFSTASPAAMARVFQAYGCRYAMLLDMNALEHTYAAVYRAQGQALHVGHLIKGMSALDKTVDGVLLPRFLGYADNRDFFYLLWKTRRER